MFIPGGSRKTQVVVGSKEMTYLRPPLNFTSSFIALTVRIIDSSAEGQPEAISMVVILMCQIFQENDAFWEMMSLISL